MYFVLNSPITPETGEMLVAVIVAAIVVLLVVGAVFALRTG